MALCTAPGCVHEAVTASRCPEHTREANRRFTSAHKPQYNSKRWRLTRRRKLFATPLCEHPGCNEIAVDVHHANGHERFFEMAGLKSLCKKHHGEVNRAEQLTGGRSKSGPLAHARPPSGQQRAPQRIEVK